MLPRELGHRDPPEPRIHAGEDPVCAIEQHDRRVVREVELRVHPPERVIHEVPQRGGELDAHGAGADDHERQHLETARGVRLTRRGFNGLDDPLAHRQSVREELRLQRVLRDARDAVVVRDAPGHQDEVVVPEGAVRGPHGLALEVHAFHLGLHEALAGVRDRQPQRVRDRMRRELAGRDLIEERREQVVVVAVDEGELDLARPDETFELSHEVEAGEAAADHDDPFRHQFGRPAVSTRASSCRYAWVIGSSASSSLASISRSRAASRSPARRCANPASAR